jgi:DNA-directed RNA polymerase subunit RPC12/RpoP
VLNGPWKSNAFHLSLPASYGVLCQHEQHTVLIFPSSATNPQSNPMSRHLNFRTISIGYWSIGIDKAVPSSTQIHQDESQVSVLSEYVEAFFSPVDNTYAMSAATYSCKSCKARFQLIKFFAKKDNPTFCPYCGMERLEPLNVIFG